MEFNELINIIMVIVGLPPCIWALIEIHDYFYR